MSIRERVCTLFRFVLALESLREERHRRKAIPKQSQRCVSYRSCECDCDCAGKMFAKRADVELDRQRIRR
jgi:hypothetical protein